MKLPRGFGKNYFSLNAITATVNQVTLNKKESALKDYLIIRAISTKEDDEEIDDEIPISCLISLQTTSCHCNHIFKNRTIKTLKLHHNAKKLQITTNT